MSFQQINENIALSSFLKLLKVFWEKKKVLTDFI